jgi:ABC-type multidrug transport system ATPase subunit
MIELVKGLDATVLFSSHIIEDVEDVADRVLVLEGGSLLFDGPLADLAQAGVDRHDPAGRRSSVEAGFLEIIAQRRRLDRPA